MSELIDLIDDAEDLEVGEFYLVSAPQQGWEVRPWILDGAIVEYIGERKVRIISLTGQVDLAYRGMTAASKFRIGGIVQISSKGFLKYRKL